MITAAKGKIRVKAKAAAPLTAASQRHHRVKIISSRAGVFIPRLLIEAPAPVTRDAGELVQ